MTPWHQDRFSWPLPADSTVTMWMPLVDLTPEVGSMTFGAGTHRRGALCDLSISDESEVELQRLVERDTGTTVDGELNPVLFRR
jgi:ectoine hydroxylase-related dioxygenase (phytanoyl-CoA dioxygenase family)